MSRRNLNYKMLDAADISSTKTSSNTNVDGVDQGSIFVQWSGSTPIGAITIEASNSKQDEFTKGTEVWEVLDFGTTIDVTGNSGSHQINFTALPFRMIRMVYTTTSGTGTLTAHLNCSSLGA